MPNAGTVESWKKEVGRFLSGLFSGSGPGWPLSWNHWSVWFGGVILTALVVSASVADVWFAFLVQSK